MALIEVLADTWTAVVHCVKLYNNSVVTMTTCRHWPVWAWLRSQSKTWKWSHRTRTCGNGERVSLLQPASTHWSMETMLTLSTWQPGLPWWGSSILPTFLGTLRSTRGLWGCTRDPWWRSSLTASSNPDQWGQSSQLDWLGHRLVVMETRLGGPLPFSHT